MRSSTLSSRDLNGRVGSPGPEFYGCSSITPFCLHVGETGAVPSRLPSSTFPRVRPGGLGVGPISGLSPPPFVIGDRFGLGTGLTHTGQSILTNNVETNKKKNSLYAVLDRPVDQPVLLIKDRPGNIFSKRLGTRCRTYTGTLLV